MHQIVPEFIITNYKAERFNGSFMAASMFLDITGFSGMTDKLMQHGQHGAEVLAQMMRTVFDPIVNAIFGQGGMIVGYAGDAISALYPIEKDEILVARRVLASAFTIQESLKTKPTYVTPYGTFQISAKIGLAVGQVSWGILRSRNGEKATYYFRGDAVDEAARAEHQAAAGDILLIRKLFEELESEIKANSIPPYYRLNWISSNFPLPQPVESPPLNPEVAAIFVPVNLINQDLRGEFRQAVNLFMRIPNLTSEQLEIFMQTFFEIQARYGGLIDRIDFGDKGCNMIVLWGAPIAYENDIGRALNFILDLKSKVDFPITAGLTYYISHAGYIGGQLYENYTCYGWGINLAARFMMSANEGEVWLDERVAQRIKKHYNYDFVGEHNFKGFAQKQSVYVLRGRKSESEFFFRGEMVGRNQELQTLTDLVAPIWSGNYAGVLGVWGEAGMGKSRLIYEFRKSTIFQERSATWAICQSDQILRHSFNPIRYWLNRYFDIFSKDDEATQLQKFHNKMDVLISSTKDNELAAELRRTRSFLAALVDLSWPDSLYSQMDAQSRYDNTIIALITLIKAESLQQPFILFIEDAHYLDEDSKAFLPRLKRALIAETIDYPIVILLTTRWQGTRVLVEEGLIDHDIDLGALSKAALSQMAVDILDKPADPILINLVDDRAEGNPFFAEQILHYLQTEEYLELKPSGWTIRKNLNLNSLPADITKMLIARLDQLTHQVKEVVQAASVLGREFEIQILSRMLVNDVSLDDDIDEAEKASVWFPLNEIRYIFKHSLMRDVAYNMQLKARRQELHVIALDALEEIYGNELGHHYGELAYHSEQAILVDKARYYLELAAHSARDSYQNLQALDYYRRALQFIPAEDLEHRYNIHKECEKLLTELGEPEERTKELESLHTLAEEIGEAGKRAEVEMLSAQILVSGGNYDKSAEIAKQAIGMALDTNRYDVAIDAYQILFDGYYQQGMYNEAIQWGDLGLELSRTHGVSRDKAFILNRLGLAYLELKDPSAATSYLEQSLEIFRADDNLRGVARVLANLGLVAGHRGDFSAALYYCEQALGLAREIGSRRGEALLLGNLGWISGLLGDYRKALGYADRNLKIAREIGDKFLEAYSFINLSSHAGALGDNEAGIEYAKQGLELSRQTNDRNAEAWALTYLGHGLFESGLLSEAKNAYQAALKLRNDLEQSVLATEPAAGLARIALTRGDQINALKYVESVMTQLKLNDTLEGTDQPLRVYLNCYLTLHSAQDARAMDVLKTAYRLLNQRADGIADPSARKLFLEGISYNNELISIWERQNLE
jgi:predicted ATPase/class 3 adenylate cyclase